MPAKTNIDVKRANKSKIFHWVYRQKQSSRPELVQALGLSFPTVLQCVNELLETGLLCETGKLQSTGGRKAKGLAVNASRNVSIGLDIAQEYFSLAVIDLAGEATAHIRIPKPFSMTEDYQSKLSLSLDAFLRKNQIDTGTVLGVGISVPGIVDHDGRCLLYSHALHLKDVFCDWFSTAVPFPCTLCNDANAAGLAEVHAMGEVQNMLYLSLNDSIGGAVFLDGALYTGQNQRGGEFGHMCLERNGKTCYCGKKGCLDAYCSGHSLARDSGLQPDVFFRELRGKNPHAVGIWEDYADHLIDAADNLRMSYDCDIVLGGDIGRELDAFLPDLQRWAAKRNIFTPDGSYLHSCKCREEASALGAALLYHKRFLDSL